MGARTKLNGAYLIGWAILAAVIGLAAGSWGVGAAALAALAVAGGLDGALRPPRPGNPGPNRPGRRAR